MTAKRIIPCLDIKDGRTVKGVHFVNFKDAGDPVELAQTYVEQGADELVFLDITATVEGRKTFVDLVRRIARHIHVPFTVGGGIGSVEAAEDVLNAGAHKVSVSSAAVRNPDLIRALSTKFGRDAVVVAIDAKKLDEVWKVFVKGGTEETSLETVAWAKKAERLGAGEILLTSMNHDGTKSGFALDITADIVKSVSIPVIASGGAGNIEHFVEVFKKTDAAAGLAASIFHFGEVSIPELKARLKVEGML